MSFEQNSKIQFTAVRYNISKGKYDEQKAKATKTKNTIRHSNNSSIHSHFLFIVGLWVYRAFIPLVDCVIFLFVVLTNSSVCVRIDYKQEDYYKAGCFLQRKAYNAK